MCNSGGNTHEETIDCSICHRAGRGDVCLRNGPDREAGGGRRDDDQGDRLHGRGATKGGGYKADDVECKDGQYDLLLDKDFKITKKDKED